MPTGKSTQSKRPGKENSNGHKPGSPPAAWTFLTNHAHVLILLHREPGLVLREVALRVGITERAVQRIVQELEEGGYLERERVGRCNQYHISSGQNLRHPIETHCTVDQLLAVVSGKAKRNSGSR